MDSSFAKETLKYYLKETLRNTKPNTSNGDNSYNVRGGLFGLKVFFYCLSGATGHFPR